MDKKQRYVERKAREKNDTMIAEYSRLMDEYEGDEDTVVREVAERFEVTPHRLRSLIARRVGTANMITKTQAEQQILNAIGSLSIAVQEACGSIRADLDRIADLQDEDIDRWYEIEQVETEGGKGDGEVKTKRIPITEKRRELESRLTDEMRKFITAVGQFAPKNVFNFQFGDGVHQLSDEDLDAQLEIEANKRKRGDEVD